MSERSGVWRERLLRGFTSFSRLRLRVRLARSGGVEESRSPHPPLWLTTPFAPAGLGLHASPNSPLLQLGVHFGEKLVVNGRGFEPVGSGGGAEPSTRAGHVGPGPAWPPEPGGAGGLPGAQPGTREKERPGHLSPLHFTNHVYLNSSAVRRALAGKALENWTHQLF